MREDFVINAIDLVCEGWSLDLHNDYDFTGVEYSVAERRVTLSWRRSGREWVNPELPVGLVLTYGGVSRFQVMPRDAEMPFTEDSCLASAGFWTDEEWCNGVMICNADDGSGWMRAFGFQSGMILAIAAEGGKAVIRDK